MQQVVQFEYFGLSDIGLIRSTNEDCWQVNPSSKVIAVADGMGGRSGGEVASHEAIENLMELIDQYKTQLEACQDDQYEQTLRQILSKVNEAVYTHSLKDIHLEGMGTTLSFLHFCHQKAWLFHVGDSRIYHFRKGHLSRLTQDHSLASRLKKRFKETEKVYTYRHILTNALGCRPYIEPDVAGISYAKEDIFVLCSDGLTNMVSDKDIRDILNDGATLQESGNILISLANSRGGTDNATVVLVRIQ